MRFKSFTIFLNLILAGIGSMYFVSCSQPTMDGMMIITQSAELMKDAGTSESSPGYAVNSQIIALDPQNLIETKLLTKDFKSACAPVISYDGKTMLFAATEKEGDNWQIWEMVLSNLKCRQVLSMQGDCIDPAYLPSGRILFSRLAEINSEKKYYPIYTCMSDGSDIKQISYHPHNNFASSVLRDGRILTITSSVYPEKGNPMFLALRPDGTKAELFYKGNSGSSILSRGCETPDGKIVFIESENGNKADGKLVSVSYNRPLHTRINISGDLKGSFNSVLPLKSGKYLVSWRASGNDRFGLYEFNPDIKELGNLVYQNAGYDVTDATMVVQSDLPKKLPSEVDMGVKTGLLLCQDINFTGMSKNTDSHISMIKLVGIDSTMGFVKVEEDGSFFLKIKADTPFQIHNIDDNGQVLNDSCDWIYLRPNERRGCVGCHEDQEMVPENRYCLSVSKDPVEIPSILKNVQEKKIELE